MKPNPRPQGDAERPRFVAPAGTAPPPQLKSPQAPPRRFVGRKSRGGRGRS